MSCINRVMLSGNLTRDPELRMTTSGIAVLSFGLAVNEKKKGNSERVHFFDCVLFGNYATAMQPYLQKGQRVAVDGQLAYHAWDQDGTRRSKVEVTVRSLDTIGPAPKRDAYDYASGQQLPIAAAPPQVPMAEVYDEDIPFS